LTASDCSGRAGH